MPRKGPAPAASSCPTRCTSRCSSPRSSTRCCCAASGPSAERIVYDALKIVEDKTGGEPIATLKRAVENVKPQLEVKSRRVGGATYQVPVEVRPRRANTLAIRWLVGYCRQRREKTMAERLANELLDASQRHRCLGEAPRGHAQDGRVEQGVRPLPLVVDADPRRAAPGARARLASARARSSSPRSNH